MVRCCNKFLILIFVIAGMVMPFSSALAQANKKVVIAIDAGHGGKDPGAVGQNGLKEKDVNFAVAKKLQALLEKDPLFQPVLTRTGDYFISVSSRSDIARNKNANFLVSIHADAAQNTSAKGASVWVLSNKRADTELGRWLEQQDKQSELLGGGGSALSHGNDNPYLSQTVIDLQFAHSQRVGYDVAVKVLSEMNKLGGLHKGKPEHVSFGVLRSPDIPSILVEVGFISNKSEEKLLGSANYQTKLANAIYHGIRGYFVENPLQSVNGQSMMTLTDASTTKSTQNTVATTKSVSASKPATETAVSQNGVHVVKANETLFSIARQYKISVANLRELNQLNNDTIRVGQKLKVSTTNSSASTNQARSSASAVATTRNNKKMTKYTVVAGDSLSVIAQKHGVLTSELKQVNKLTTDNVKVGQVLTIP